MEIEAINKLIETDEKTRAEVQRQHDKRENLRSMVDAQKKKLAAEAWADVNARVEDTKKQLDEQIAAIETKSSAYYDKAAASLQKQYDENHTVWKKQLLNRVLNEETE